MYTANLKNGQTLLPDSVNSPKKACYLLLLLPGVKLLCGAVAGAKVRVAASVCEDGADGVGGEVEGSVDVGAWDRHPPSKACLQHSQTVIQPSMRFMEDPSQLVLRGPIDTEPNLSHPGETTYRVWMSVSECYCHALEKRCLTGRVGAVALLHAVRAHPPQLLGAEGQEESLIGVVGGLA